MNDLRRRQERLDRARRLARIELLAGFASPLFAGFLWIAAPGFMFGGWRSDWWVVGYAPAALALAGVVGVILGLAWMVRIYRADPEPGERTWRYRVF